MIAVRLPKVLENKLEKVAHDTHRSKSYYIRVALEKYFEDREDIKRMKRWQHVTKLVIKSSRIVNKDFQKYSKIKSD